MKKFQSQMGWTTLTSGVRKRKITPKGAELEVAFIDGTASWIPIKDLKESNPIETAKFAVSRNIQDEPVFAWWVTHVMRNRAAIIKKVSTQTAKKSIKFGILIPNNIDHADRLDAESNNTFWEQLIQKEVSNAKVTFNYLKTMNQYLLALHICFHHFIFDFKFNLTRKDRCVVGGHQKKNIPIPCTYASVVSRYSVRIVFLLAALNELTILTGDIGNTYLNVSCKERVHVPNIDSPLFGPESKKKTAVIIQALYGLRSAGFFGDSTQP